MFLRSPVIKLSIPTTRHPSAINLSHKCEPKNPAAPVTTTLFIFPFYLTPRTYLWIYI